MRSWTTTVTRRGHWVALDVVVVAASVFGGLYLSSQITAIAFDLKFTPLKFLIIFVVLLCSLIAANAIRLKAFRRWQTMRDDIRTIAVGTGLSAVVVIILFVLFQATYKPLWVAVSDGLCPSVVTLVVMTATRGLERLARRYLYERTTVFFVEIEQRWYASLATVRAVLSDDWQLVVVNSPKLTDEAELPDGVEFFGLNGSRDWLSHVDEPGCKALLVLGTSQPKTDIHNALIEKAYCDRIPITNMVDFYEEILEKSPLFETETTWFSSSGKAPPRQLDLFLKRVIDILFALPLLLLIIPLIGVLAIIIRRESQGPAIFKQDRVGLDGRLFTAYKLRTMTVHADDSASWPNFEIDKVTRFGRVLRKLGLDELPQILNVIKGDMSFVGPRPARPLVTERHIARTPFYAVVKSVKPGISGWAQLHQGQDANDDTMFEKTRYNLYYAKYYSIWLDILIYIRTFSQLVMGRKRESVFEQIHSKKLGEATAAKMPEFNENRSDFSKSLH